ncbi:MAG: BTAD domain-containing putative transcriptional regulator [Xanthobacteraceae bacterium]
MESTRERLPGRQGGLRLRLLGPPAVSAGGELRPLPPSRKVRALLAYLAVAPRPASRSQLCELFWDVPDDPRSELRWSLAKIRALLRGEGVAPLTSADDHVALDLSQLAVDALEVEAALRGGAAALATERLVELAGLFAGEFLEGGDLDRCPAFQSWLVARRQACRMQREAILRELIKRAAPGSAEALGYAEAWTEFAPFEPQAHGAVLATLIAQGRKAEAEERFAAAMVLLRNEGVDSEPLAAAWRTFGKRHAAAEAALPAAAAADAAAAKPTVLRRASIAILPFQETGSAGSIGGYAAGLTHDVITRLAKLRSLPVIARGSVFALAEQGFTPDEIAGKLGVDYAACGTVRTLGAERLIAVDLVETATGRILWSEQFARQAGDDLKLIDEVGDRIVATLASEIELAERNRAVLKAPNTLDAWEAYHRGLWHMYRFNQPDNDCAQDFFRRSIGLDPTFSRSYAGLSFTHFQNAFLLRPQDRQRESELAFKAAGDGLAADDRDPAAHWAMGRALWLRGEVAGSLNELSTAVELSPNYALGHYTLAFVHAQSGEPRTAIAYADQSRALSPYDPLLFAMLATRAIALMRLGEYEEAAEWGRNAAARPNAHAHIMAISALCGVLAGRTEEARGVVASLLQGHPGYGIDHFFAAFRFDPPLTKALRRIAGRIGL